MLLGMTPGEMWAGRRRRGTEFFLLSGYYSSLDLWKNFFAD